MDVPSTPPHRAAGKGLAMLKNLPPWAYIVGAGVFIFMFIYMRRQQDSKAAQMAAATANANQPTPAAGPSPDTSQLPYDFYGGNNHAPSIIYMPNPQGPQPPSNPVHPKHGSGVVRFPPPGNAPQPGSDPPSPAPPGWYYTAVLTPWLYTYVLVPVSPAIKEDSSIVPSLQPPAHFSWSWQGDKGFGWLAIYGGVNNNVVQRPQGVQQQDMSNFQFSSGGGAPSRPGDVHTPILQTEVERHYG